MIEIESEVTSVLYQLLEKVSLSAEEKDLGSNLKGVESEVAAVLNQLLKNVPLSTDEKEYGSQVSCDLPSPLIPEPPCSPILDDQSIHPIEGMVQFVFPQESQEEENEDNDAFDLLSHTAFFSNENVSSTCDMKTPESSVDDSSSDSNFSSKTYSDSNLQGKDSSEHSSQGEEMEEEAGGDVARRTVLTRDPYEDVPDVKISAAQWTANDIKPIPIVNFVCLEHKVGLSKRAKVASLHPYLKDRVVISSNVKNTNKKMKYED